MDKLIQEIMSSDVISANQQTTLGKLKLLMEECLFSHIPIVGDNNKLIGIVSKIDMLKAFWQKADDKENSSKQLATIQAKDMMQSNVVSVKNNATINQAIDILMDRNFHSLPVVNDHGQLVGMITTNDLLLELRNFYH